MLKPTGKPVRHGTESGYSKFGCRCDACRAAKAAVAKAYRERHAIKVAAAKRAYYLANRAELDAKNRAWIAANRDRHRATQRAYLAALDPETRAAYGAKAKLRYQANRQGVLARTKAWHEANPERRAEIAKAWREANPDRVREVQRRWRQTHPDAVVANSARRRTRKRRGDVRQITLLDWQRLCARHDHRCAYCGRQVPLTQDHVVPLARGGRHAIGNLLPACTPCNSSKRDRLLVEWRARRIAA